MAKSAFGSNHFARESITYKVQGSLGQTSPIGNLTSANHMLTSGYWNMLANTHIGNVIYLPMVTK